MSEHGTFRLKCTEILSMVWRPLVNKKSLIVVLYILPLFGPLLAQQKGLSFAMETVQLTVESEEGDEIEVLIREGNDEMAIKLEASALETIIPGVPARSVSSSFAVRVSGKEVSPIVTPESIQLSWPAAPGDAFEVLASRDGDFWMPRELVVAETERASVTVSASGDQVEFFGVRTTDEIPSIKLPGSLVGWVVMREGQLRFSAPDRRLNNDEVLTAFPVSLGELQTVTDESGRFEFREIESGQYPLVVGKSAPALMREVLVVPNQEIAIGNEELSRDEAYQLFLDRVAQSRPNLNLNQVQVVGSSHVFPAGTPVTSFDALGREPTFNQMIPQEPFWLFFLDPFTTQAYGHPTLIGVVREQTKSVLMREYRYWPVVSGLDVWVSLEEQIRQGLLLDPSEEPMLFVADGPDLLEPIVERRADETGANPDSKCEKGRLFSVFFQGGRERTFGVSAEKFKAHVKPDVSKKINPDKDILGSRVDSSISAVYERIVKRMFPLMRPCDTLMIYLAGHGAIDTKDNPAAGVVFVDTDGGNLAAADILRPLKNLPACNLVVVIDSCFAGSMVRKALGPTNQTFETLAGIQLPKYVNGLFIGSTDGKTAATFKKVRGVLFTTRSDAGGLFTLELIKENLFSKPFDLAAIEKGVTQLVAKKGSASNVQQATTFFRPADPSVPCVVQAVDEKTEIEPNDSSETATPLVDESNVKQANGKLGVTNDDTDFFKTRLEKGTYRIEDLGGDYDLFVSGGGFFFEGRAPLMDFSLPETSDVTLRLSGGTSEAYDFSVSKIEPVMQVVVENQTTDWAGFRLVADGGLPIGNEAIILQRGERLELNLTESVSSLDLVDLHRPNTNFEPSDRPTFPLDPSGGSRIVFRIDGGAQEDTTTLAKHSEALVPFFPAGRQ